MVGPFLFATNLLAAKATADLIPPVALAFFRWLGALLLLAAVPGVGAYAAYAFIVERLGPGEAGLILYMVPVIGVLMAWLLLGEAPAWYHYTGAVLVLAGIWLANRRSAKDSNETRNGNA